MAYDKTEVVVSKSQDAIRKLIYSNDRNGYIRSDKSKANAVEQENRRVWRVLSWHLKAMFEAADSGVIDVRNVIMPYVVLKDGRTLADHVIPRMPQLMELNNTERLLIG